MKHKTRSFRPVLFSVWLVALSCARFGHARAAAQIIYDLRRDWSDAANPNGAIRNIAGICNSNRNVFGMMPHPERASEELLGSADGRVVFRSLAATISELVKA